MTINIKNFFRRFLTCLSLYSVFLKDVIAFIDVFQKDCDKSGYVHTVKQYKQMKLHITRVMCGSPLLINNIEVGVDKKGWPKRVHMLKPLFDHSNFGKTLVLTLMSITRCFKYGDGFEAKIDQSTIKSVTDPDNSSGYVVPHSFIKDFIKMLDSPQIDLSFDKDDVYLSTKSSINGPATLTAVDSCRNISARQFYALSKLTCNRGFDYLVKLIGLGKVTGPEPYFASKCDAHRSSFSAKLSFVNDPDFKVRTIAIFDYPSQLYLKKIHKGLMNILRSIPTDRTFTQDPNFPVNRTQKF